MYHIPAQYTAKLNGTKQNISFSSAIHSVSQAPPFVIFLEGCLPCEDIAACRLRGQTRALDMTEQSGYCTRVSFTPSLGLQQGVLAPSVSAFADGVC